jgi:hypothetical protein
VPGRDEEKEVAGIKGGNSWAGVNGMCLVFGGVAAAQLKKRLKNAKHCCYDKQQYSNKGYILLKIFV